VGKRRKVSDLPAKSEGRGIGPELALFRNNGISTRVTARNCDALIVLNLTTKLSHKSDALQNIRATRGDIRTLKNSCKLLGQLEF